MSVLRIGEKTLVANIGGKLYQKVLDEVITLELYEQIVNSSDEEKLDFFKPKKTLREIEVEKEINEKKEKLKSMTDILDFMKDVRDNGNDILEVKNNSFYLKGINISLPELLVKEIINAKDLDNLIDSLINFWSLCAQNPDPRPRHDLFKFLKGGGFTTTESGYFITYRNANIKNKGNSNLQEFVTKEWTKIKTKWKKSPKNYLVFEENERFFISKVTPSGFLGKFRGNLDSLYSNISEISKTVYTDAYSGTTTIKIGHPVKQDRSLCNPDPNADCSKGLHVGNKSFMSRNSFGRVGLICLVNPKNVVAVPHYNHNKMRVCEYLPIAIAEYDDSGKLIEVDTKLFEYELLKNTNEEIDVMMNLSSTELEEYKLNEFIAPEIDLESLKTIYKNISLSQKEANKIAKERFIVVED